MPENKDKPKRFMYQVSGTYKDNYSGKVYYDDTVINIQAQNIPFRIICSTLNEMCKFLNKEYDLI